MGKKPAPGHHITYHVKDDSTKCSCGWVPEEDNDTLEASANHIKEN